MGQLPVHPPQGRQPRLSLQLPAALWPHRRAVAAGCPDPSDGVAAAQLAPHRLRDLRRRLPARALLLFGVGPPELEGARGGPSGGGLLGRAGGPRPGLDHRPVGMASPLAPGCQAARQTEPNAYLMTAPTLPTSG